MSTNPFRKSLSSSLKGPGGSSAPNTPSDPRGISPGGLSLDTRVAGTSQKHVNFASPPAIPISPVSYPPSPESTRQEFLPGFPSPKPPLPGPTDYSQALTSDPFAAEASDAEDDRAIEQALENAKANNNIIVAESTTSNSAKEDAVRDTLGRFAGPPRRPTTMTTAESLWALNAKDQGAASRPAMDVDAFKRMLLTGDRGSSSSRDTVVPNATTGPIPVSDSGSSADTASISQRSIFETAPPTLEESPRTSDDLDGNEANEQRVDLAIGLENRRKPPPPKSRRTKPPKEPEEGRSSKFDDFINSLSGPSGRNQGSEGPSPMSSTVEEPPQVDRSAAPNSAQLQKRVPPAPPLARRKSQQAPTKPVLTRSSSSRHSVLSDYDPPPSPSSTNPTTSRPPPPPPARRSNSSGDRRPSFDVASIPEDDSQVDGDLRPGLPHTPSYLKRLSQGAPPPVPPPRRGRGSSRSSIETTRPSMASLGLDETGLRDGNVGLRGGLPHDILADLAALQREVDAARAGAGQ